MNPNRPVSPILRFTAAFLLAITVLGCGGKQKAKVPAVSPAPDPAARIQALETAINAAKRNPRDPSAAFEAGRACGDMGRYEDAITWFRHMERLAPKEPAAKTAQGQMWIAIGRPLMAVRSYERALKLVPNEARLHVELARAYTDLRDYQSAVRHGLEAEELDPKGDVPQRALASAFAEMLDGPKSQAHAEKATQLRPENAENWLLLASLLLRNRKLPEAETAVKRALAIDTASPAANTVYATLLIEAHKSADADRQAFAIASRARTTDPGYAPALLLQGQILARAGKYSEAVGVLRQAREADPRDPEIVRALGQALIRNGRNELGVKLVTVSQQMPQRSVGFSGLENQALKTLDPALVMRLADLYERQHMYDLAINVLEKALRRSPNNRRMQQRLIKAQNSANRLGVPKAKPK